MLSMGSESPVTPFKWFLEHQRQLVQGRGSSAYEYEEKAVAVRKRYEQEKREYNDTLDLEDEILTDQEALNECECGNGANDIRVETERLRCEQKWTRYRRDHPKFNKGHHASEEGVDSRSFNRFNDLPVEIKNQIYQHVLCDSKVGGEIRQWQVHYESKGNPFELRFTDLQPLDTRILVASREIYNSALHQLYSVKTFVVDISDFTATPLFVRDATNFSSPRPTSRIRRWHIRLFYGQLTDKALIMPQIIALRDALKQCANLEEIRFTWMCSPVWRPASSDMIHSFDSMLKLFAVVHGVGKVIFTKKLSKRERERMNKWLDGCRDIELASQEAREVVKAAMESPRT